MSDKNQPIEEKKGEEKVETKVETKVEAKTVATKPAVKTTPTSGGAAKVVAKSIYGERKTQQKRMRRGRPEKKDDFDQRILDIARVTRVMAGGKRMSFRACVAIGDKKGKVAVGLGKGADVSMAVNKAVNCAKRDMISVSMVNNTIPHEVFKKLGAAKILFKPAREGRGVIAGGIVRIIVELAGIKNITSKILGTNNKINNARCTIEAFRQLKRVETPNNTDKKKKEKETDKKEIKQK